MYCPICKKSLTRYEPALLCPAGHGVLVTGRFLGDIEKTSLEDNIPPGSSHINTSHHLICPRCSGQMQKVNYNHTGIIIDVCISCSYRWLDKGEVNKIKNYKPNFKPEDLLLIDSINQKTKELEPIDSDVNPRIPRFNIIRLVSSGDSRRTLAALGGMGLYGIVVGMIKSKLLRVVIPLMLLFFALGYYFIIKSFN